ncbi:unnamed protein product [Tetraodon nigroviridis]|uniref:(spotted green pufferfish) hypothetical protein n=1 Tax=Tetraodon nigroviridis TaxID=99883 RepID=Q4T473_TETNG|nr:unnamed protein product [Tetraodon nigroviridis]
MGTRAAARQPSAFKHGSGAQLCSPLCAAVPLIASLQLFDFSLSCAQIWRL